jgi:hypothetical protein
LQELEDDKTTTSQSIGYRDWVAKLLKTNLRAYRLRVVVASCTPAKIQRTESTLNALKLTLLRLDPGEGGSYRFNLIVLSKLSDLHDMVLGIRRHMLRIVDDKDQVEISWLDVTEVEGDWHVM